MGYLYIVDMYRQHIETPVSIPEELKTDMDFSNGDQYGRIYRVYPGNGNQKNLTVLISGAKPRQSWWRCCPVPISGGGCRRSGCY